MKKYYVFCGILGFIFVSGIIALAMNKGLYFYRSPFNPSDTTHLYSTLAGDISLGVFAISLLIAVIALIIYKIYTLLHKNK